jgi:hypothetical protein
MTDDEIVGILRRRAAGGAGMVELVDLVHELDKTPRYNRGLILRWFSRAFQLKPLDFTGLVLGCELFGDGATMSVAEAERRFAALMSKRRRAGDAD